MEVIYPKKFDLSSCTSSIDQVSTVLSEINKAAQLIENHTVTLLDEYTWNGYTTNIYLLSGGIPASMTVEQYIREVCEFEATGTVFVSKDAATGLIDVFLYPVEYVKMLIDNNVVIEIGVDKYVLITSCEIQINDNELGEQLATDTQTEENTSYQNLDNGGWVLYNWWAAMHASKITSSDDWYIPTRTQVDTMRTYLAGIGVTGGAFKSVDVGEWEEPNVGALDSYGVGVVGAGTRSKYNGDYSNYLSNANFWTSTSIDAIKCYWAFGLNTVGDVIAGSGSAFKNSPSSVLIFRDAPGVADGTIGSYVGNDGREYVSVCFNEKYMVFQIQETMYRDGTVIPYVPVDADWVALEAAAEAGVCVANGQEYQILTSGSVSGVDNDGEIVTLTIDENGQLNEPKKVSELDRKTLIPVFMRKIN
nr:FISUMP domain-containing protein [uncultured Draconibacterium sp.]